MTQITYEEACISLIKENAPFNHRENQMALDTLNYQNKGDLNFSRNKKYEAKFNKKRTAIKDSKRYFKKRGLAESKLIPRLARKPLWAFVINAQNLYYHLVKLIGSGCSFFPTKRPLNDPKTTPLTNVTKETKKSAKLADEVVPDRSKDSPEKSFDYNFKETHFSLSDGVQKLTDSNFNQQTEIDKIDDLLNECEVPTNGYGIDCLKDWLIESVERLERPITRGYVKYCVKRLNSLVSPEWTAEKVVEFSILKQKKDLYSPPTTWSTINQSAQDRMSNYDDDFDLAVQRMAEGISIDYGK